MEDDAEKVRKERESFRVNLPSGKPAVPELARLRQAEGALIAEVILPGAALWPRSAFVKLGPRRDLTIARLNLAAMAEYHDGRFGEVRLLAGALGPRPVALTRAAMALGGRVLSSATLRELLAALAADVDAAIPGRASRLWKRRAIGGLGLDLVAALAGMSPRDALFDEVA